MPQIKMEVIDNEVVVSVKDFTELEVVCKQIIKESRTFFKDECIVDTIKIKLVI